MLGVKIKYATFSSQGLQVTVASVSPSIPWTQTRGAAPSLPWLGGPYPRCPHLGRGVSLVTSTGGTTIIMMFCREIYVLTEAPNSSCFTKIHSRRAEWGLLRPCGLRGEVPAEVPDTRISVEPSSEDGDKVPVCHTGIKEHGDYWKIIIMKKGKMAHLLILLQKNTSVSGNIIGNGNKRSF